MLTVIRMVTLPLLSRVGKGSFLKQWYANFPVKASAYIECGNCVARCPFGVDIIVRMLEAVKLFENE